MTERFCIGHVDRKVGALLLPTATLITKEENGGYVGKTVSPAAIPIPESLTGCPDQALVFITPVGLMAWDCDGELRTEFDHVNE